MLRGLTMGAAGQLRLRASSVLIVGAGGLGCPAAAYLAGAGIGRIGVADGDTVEASNLLRQIAHSTSRIGTPKAEKHKTQQREKTTTTNNAKTKTKRPLSS